jgi:hypothetical protein
VQATGTATNTKILENHATKRPEGTRVTSPDLDADDYWQGGAEYRWLPGRTSKFLVEERDPVTCPFSIRLFDKYLQGCCDDPERIGINDQGKHENDRTTAPLRAIT